MIKPGDTIAIKHDSFVGIGVAGTVDPSGVTTDSGTFIPSTSVFALETPEDIVKVQQELKLTHDMAKFEMNRYQEIITYQEDIMKFLDNMMETHRLDFQLTSQENNNGRN